MHLRCGYLSHNYHSIATTITAALIEGTMTVRINRQLMREARENAGLSQEGLARQVGVSKNTIQRMETLKGYNVKIQLLGKVARKIGLLTIDLILED